MKKINFYEKKCQALEIFYCWVDQGSEYDIAVDLVFKTAERLKCLPQEYFDLQRF